MNSPRRTAPAHPPRPPASLAALVLAALTLLLAPLRAQPPAPAPDDSAAEPNSQAIAALDILPIGEESRGVVLPDYDAQGNLTSLLKARSAVRTSQTEITLEAMRLTLSQPAPRSGLLLDLPAARFDLSTSMLFGLRDVRVSRDDFVLTGDTLEFDTKNRRGVLRGSIRMVLRNNTALTAPATSRPTPAP